LNASPWLVGNGPTEVVIPQDMRVELRLMEGLSTVTDHKGYVVHLEVASDLVADGIVVVPAGTPITVKLTRAGSRIEFSDPKLMVDGRKVRLSELNSQQRGELGAETGAAIGMVIFAAPLIAIQLPISAGYALVHRMRTADKPSEYVFMDKGETFTYYVRDRMRVKVIGR
jgi:hypothetical protein